MVDGEVTVVVLVVTGFDAEEAEEELVGTAVEAEVVVVSTLNVVGKSSMLNRLPGISATLFFTVTEGERCPKICSTQTCLRRSRRSGG